MSKFEQIKKIFMIDCFYRDWLNKIIVKKLCNENRIDL